jgi:hypothetical protein
MKCLRQFAFGTIAVVFLASSAVMSFAGDPPTRVARLKYITGQVSMQPGGVNDWADATINRPMTTADRLWTDKDARAELHLGSAAMRMDSETSLTLSNLSDNTVQLELDQGTLNLQVARLMRGEIYEVDTPNTAFTVLKPGNYRFDVDSRGDATLLTVWKGKGIATGSGQAVRIDSKRQVRLMGGMSMAHAEYNAPRLDGFDQWCQTRADREAHSISVRYVSPDVVGYEDLDAYGSWRAVPSYGTVWFPTRVEAGWAPYRDGHWVWMDPWGWTWVDDAPWGYAPFHYGRWVFVFGSWAWAPGPINVRPCYAPALVAWVGGSGAGVGWFPLGYGEPYIPSYHVSRGYFQTVNISNTRITNITYVTNNYYNVTNVRISNIHYVNQTRAVTIVDNDVMVNSRRVDRDVFMDHDRDRRDDRNRWVMAGPPVPPSHQSVVGMDHDRPAPEPPRIGPRHVVVNVQPPDPPASFETRHPEVASHNDHPMETGNDNRYRQHMPVISRPDASGSGDRNVQASRDRQPSPDRNENAQPWDNQRGDDRDRHNSVADQGRDYPSSVPRPQRHGDDDRGQQSSTGGNYPGPRQPEQNPNSNDGNRRADRGDNAQNPGSRWEQPRGNGSSDGRQFPHPPQHGQDDGRQRSSNGSNDNEGRGDRGQETVGQRNNNGQSTPPQSGQNPSVNDDHRADHGGDAQNSGSRWGQSQGNDSSAGRQFPHPAQHGENDHGQQSSNGSNNPAPQQPVQNPNVNNGDARADHGGSPQNPGSKWEQPQRNDSSAASQIPQPPKHGDGNRGQQPTPGGGYNPAPRQAGQNLSVNDGQSQGNNGGNARYGSNPAAQGNDAGSGRPVPRPEYPTRSMPVSQPVSSQRPDVPGRTVSSAPVQQPESAHDRPVSPVPERQVPSPSNGNRSVPAPPAQQPYRSTLPQQTAAHNNPAPSAPAPRAAVPQRAPQSDSHASGSKDSGANGNPHGSAFQEHSQSKVQDR